MNIKYAVYESLTPRQRIIATIEAWARGDEAEGQRLAKTCPKVTCRGNESAYVERIKALKYMAVVVECDMRSAVISLLMRGYFSREKDDRPDWYSDLLRHPWKIRELLSIHEAWESTLQEEGIDPVMMDKMMMTNGLRHTLIKFFVDIAEDHDVLSDPEVVKEYKGLLTNYLDKVGG